MILTKPKYKQNKHNRKKPQLNVAEPPKPPKIKKPTPDQLAHIESLFHTRSYFYNRSFQIKALKIAYFLLGIYSPLVVPATSHSYNEYTQNDVCSDSVYTPFYELFGADNGLIVINNIQAAIGSLITLLLARPVVPMLDPEYQLKETLQQVLQEANSRDSADQIIKRLEEDTKHFACTLVDDYKLIICLFILCFFTLPILASFNLVGRMDVYGLWALGIGYSSCLPILSNIKMKNHDRVFEKRLNQHYEQLDDLLGDYIRRSNMLKTRLLSTSTYLFEFDRKATISPRATANMVRIILAAYSIKSRVTRNNILLVNADFVYNAENFKIIAEKIKQNITIYADNKNLPKQLNKLGEAIRADNKSTVSFDNNGFKQITFTVQISNKLADVLTQARVEIVFPQAKISVANHELTIVSTKKGIEVSLDSLIQDVLQKQATVFCHVSESSSSSNSENLDQPKEKIKTRGTADEQVPVEPEDVVVIQTLHFNYQNEIKVMNENQFREMEPGLIAVYYPNDKFVRKYAAVHQAFNQILINKKIVPTRFGSNGLIKRETGTSQGDVLKVLGTFGVFRSHCLERVKGTIGEREVDVMYFNSFKKH